MPLDMGNRIQMLGKLICDMQNNLLKRFIWFFFFSCILNFGQSKILNFPLFEFNISLGSESFNMDKALSLFNDAKSIYRSQGINMPDQNTFPSNYFLSFNLGLSLADSNLFGGFIYKYSSTSAYSLYADRLGEIDLRSDILYKEYLVFLKYYLSGVKLVRPFIMLTGGIGTIDFTFNDKGSIEILNTKYNTLLSGEGSAFSGSISIGVSHQIWLIYIFEKASYRFNKIENLDIEIKEKSKVTSQQGIPFEFNFNQILFEVGIGLKI